MDRDDRGRNPPENDYEEEDFDIILIIAVVVPVSVILLCFIIACVKWNRQRAMQTRAAHIAAQTVTPTTQPPISSSYVPFALQTSAPFQQTTRVVNAAPLPVYQSSTQASTQPLMQIVSGPANRQNESDIPPSYSQSCLYP